MTNAPRLPVVSPLESKVMSLAAFIEANLPQTCNDAAIELTLVARSHESPIAQAVVRHSGLIAERGIRVRALFAVATAQGEAGAWTLRDGGIEFDRDVRSTYSPRYFDAHEQLVLATSSSWIGDCMRRDPSKRDALDLARPACLDTALFANRSFEKLWRLGRPLSITSGRGKSNALVAELTTVARANADITPAEIEKNQ